MTREPWRTVNKLKVSALSAAILITGSVVGIAPASPAAAATPKCTIRQLWGSTSGGVGFVWAPQNSSGTTAKCSMEQGDNNRAVYALQDAIKNCYRISIRVDGDFGNGTYTALRTVQQRLGVGVDGSYGPETASKILMRPDDSSAPCGRLY
jgi:peptidoglycan hydrolase-like protein with peptidoglycan-binding domain